jgi:hypothetical protein
VEVPKIVHINKPQILHHLNNNIKVEIWSIIQDTFRKVMESVLLRAQQCAALGGGHLNDISFHKL